MDINLTLLGEILTFGVLIFVTLKYIWPPLTKALTARQEKIASGLAASERGQHDLEIAQNKAKEILSTAQKSGKHIIEEAEKERTKIVESAKDTAVKESEKLLKIAEANLDREKSIAKQEVREHLAMLVTSATKKILENKIDAKTDEHLIDKFIEELGS